MVLSINIPVTAFHQIPTTGPNVSFIFLKGDLKSKVPLDFIDSELKCIFSSLNKNPEQRHNHVLVNIT